MRDRMKFEFTLSDLRLVYPECTDELLEKLRVAMVGQNLPKTSDEKLAIFAHSCYFDHELTMRCISNFYKQRAASPELFGNMDPDHETMQRTLDTLYYACMPVTSPEGYRIIIHKLIDTRPQSYLMNDAIKMLIMATEYDFYEHGCRAGNVLILDATGLRLAHLMRVSLSSLRKLLDYVQEAMPVRLKGIYVVNTVWFIGKFLTLVRPFLSKEIYDMIRIYTGDISEIYAVLPPQCLPKDYGGELASIEEYHAELRLTLHKWRDQFLEDELLYRNRETKYNPEKDGVSGRQCIEEFNYSNDDDTDKNKNS